jgi:predicted AAA+ superfamily ATPase
VGRPHRREKSRGIYSWPPLIAKPIGCGKTGLFLPTKPPEKDTESLSAIALLLERIATSLEAMAPARNSAEAVLTEADAYHWDASMHRLNAVPVVARVPLDLLRGIDDVRDILLGNTLQFARGFAANNALLWGARGMGKSSLVKALHGHVVAMSGSGLKRLILVEIAREDIESLPHLMRIIAAQDARFIVFCDDLSFDRDETSYKSLKTMLDGGLEGRPENVLFYATSNRRHLMPRDMIDNERSTAITPGEAVDEKISLSDRFGLWLGFHNCDQPTFLEMVRGYCNAYDLTIDDATLRARAIEWSATRGARSGRVAIQFVRQLAGEQGKAI